MSGIYKILNKKNNKVYIGRTLRDFEARWNEHKESLLNNNHANSDLQKDWNLHGVETFDFSVIERVSTSHDIPLEEIIRMAKGSSKTCYNKSIRRSINTLRAISKFTEDDRFLVYLECLIGGMVWSLVVKDLLSQKVYYFVRNLETRSDKVDRLNFINTEHRRILINISKPIRNYHKEPNLLYELIEKECVN